MSSIDRNSPVFITGASGFIGGKIAGRLLQQGRPVRVLSRKPLPEFEKLGATVVTGDLDDPGALFRGAEGAGTVFHVAGRVGVWGAVEEFFHVNVEGTRNVISICQALSTPRLIYTSSPSVVYNGGDLRGVNESAPLCTEAPCAYPTSKAAAEREVAQANSPELSTVSLRPHLVWGPGDQNLVPRMLDLADKGRLKIIGSGQNTVDLTHIANVVDAHLQAENALADKSALVGGKAYFITNGEPVLMWEWINQVLRGLNLPQVTRRMSLKSAGVIGGVFETLWRLLPLLDEPPLTRFMAREMATDHWFDISAARRELGYEPRITMAAGTAELIELYRASYGN
jgi:2-alkyl-3-oxoalkanoate reductase